MVTQDRYLSRTYDQAADIDQGLRSYKLRVYNYMASGLLLTGIVAYFVANTPAVLSLFFARVAGGAVQPTILGYAAIFSPLAFMLVMSFGINRMSFGTAQAVYWAFAAVMGISVSTILLQFTGA